MKKAAVLLAAGVLLAAILSALRFRLAWERGFQTVEICADSADFEWLARLAGVSRDTLYRRLRQAGVGSVGVYLLASEEQAVQVEPDRLREAERAVRASIAALRRVGLAAVARPINLPLPPSRLLAPFADCRALLPAGTQAIGFPGSLEETARWLRQQNGVLPLSEFSRAPGLIPLARLVPDRTVRAHVMLPAEATRLTPKTAIGRFQRACRERGIRFLYLRALPGDLNSNLLWIAALSEELRKDGFSLGLVRPPAQDQMPLESARRIWLRQAEAWLLAAIAPVFGLLAALRLAGGCGWRWAAGVGICLLGGLGVAAVLSEPRFLLGIERFRGVRPAYLAAGAAGFFALVPLSQTGRFLRRPLALWHLALAASLGAAGLLLLMRTGNFGGFVPAVEMELRETLEETFGVRPRFKEFLFGHPLFLLGLWLRPRAPKVAAVLLWLGLLGFASILNSFCHAHTPLFTTVYRTLLGAALGGVIGGGMIFLAARRRTPAALP